MSTCAEEHPAFSFVQALYRSKELAAALARYASAGTLCSIKKRSLAAGLSVASAGHQHVSHGAAVVAKLVLGQNLEASEHSFSCQPTEEGLEALALVQAAVFGPGSLGRPFTECVFLASLEQATQALDLVTAALLDAAAPSNCLSLLNVAHACGCAPLRRRARAMALRGFAAAAQQDVNGLLRMEERCLMGLLRSDALQVGSELEVFRALAAWTEFDLPARQPRLAARLAAAVRLGSLSLPELYTLGDHPLLASDRPSNQLVAQAVIHLMMGVPLDCPLGLPTISRRRQPAAAVSSDSSEEAASLRCGLEEHAGAHGSVFEAAACAFARQRQQRAAAAGDLSPAASPAASPASAAAEPEAPGSAARIAPPSPPALDAPTPTGAMPAAASAAPAVQATARVRNLGLAKRVGSRRTLFGLGDGGACDGAEAGSCEGDKANAGTRLAGSQPAGSTDGAAPSNGSGSSSGGARTLRGGVSLEMEMSPNHASTRALALASAAVLEPLPAALLGSRKRLRFD